MRIFKDPSLDYVLWFVIALCTLLVAALPMVYLYEHDYEVRVQQAAEAHSLAPTTNDLDGKIYKKSRLVVVNGKLRRCALTDNDKLLCTGGKD